MPAEMGPRGGPGRGMKRLACAGNAQEGTKSHLWSGAHLRKGCAPIQAKAVLAVVAVPAIAIVVVAAIPPLVACLHGFIIHAVQGAGLVFHALDDALPAGSQHSAIVHPVTARHAGKGADAAGAEGQAEIVFQVVAAADEVDAVAVASDVSDHQRTVAWHDLEIMDVAVA